MKINLSDAQYCESCRTLYSREMNGMATCPACAGNHVMDLGRRLALSTWIADEPEIDNTAWMREPKPDYSRLDESLARRKEREKILRVAFGTKAKIKMMLV